jgi:hypothetical protein
MWAVIHCLKTWGHYIGSKDVVVWTDNVTLKYFATQPKLSSKQVRWQDTLALFNVDIRHKPRKENVVPDALSRKHQLKMVYVGETKFQKEVRLGSRHDEFAKERKKDIQRGMKSHFHLQNGLLWYKKNRLYVPKGRLRDVLLKECHDGPLAGHGGAKRTTTFLKKSYYWPNLKEDAEEYVKTCLTCQQNRILNKRQAGLLRPLPIPEGSWESVSMDFMVSLPPSKGFDAIMVVVATLASGSRPRQKGLQGCGPRGSPGVTSETPGSVGECEGVSLHTPKTTPKLREGVPVDSRNFRERFEGSNLNGFLRSLYQWKALEAQMSKMGSRCSFGHLKHKL